MRESNWLPVLGHGAARTCCTEQAGKVRRGAFAFALPSVHFQPRRIYIRYQTISAGREGTVAQSIAEFLKLEKTSLETVYHDGDAHFNMQLG